MGTGIYLLFKGCFQYYACDVNDLMKHTPDSFYEKLFKRLEIVDNNQENIGVLKRELKKAKAGNLTRLNYILREDFDFVSDIGEATVDLVFSQAAFEHFDDINETINRLSKVCKPGAILIAEIDLITHSRWIRDRDPNNIYRYPDHVYNAFWYRGIPNRVRPFQYKKAFENFGWTDISITPQQMINDYNLSYSGMNRAFVDYRNQMDYSSITLCARKKTIESL